MAKIIFEFDALEEKDEASHAFHGLDYYCAIEEFGQWLRTQWKWNDKLTSEQYVFLETVREEFYNRFGSLLDQ